MLSNSNILQDAAIEYLSNGIYSTYFDYDYLEHYHECEYELVRCFRMSTYLM